MAGACILLTGCAGGSVGGAFSPKGEAAADIARLWWFMLGTSSVVYVAVVALVVMGVLRRAELTADHERGDRLFIVGGGLVLPGVVLAALLGFNIYTALALPAGDGTVDVQVIGNRWWWEVRYPDAPGGGFVSANELHVPVGEKVRVRLYSDDVNHSFWVPELAGKRDMIPGKETFLVLQATEAGTFPGRCAEFCGIQHANMAFFVVAHPPDEYEAWLERAAADAPEPRTEAERVGYETFHNASCVACHAIRGTPANGQIGPDLTHFASRIALGAGAAPNDRGHLGGWVVNPQTLKPGNLMPPQDIPAEGLPALLDYLESLE